MRTVAISLVNLNCLEHTKNLISDLDRQTYSDFEIFLYDQNSSESGTEEFLTQMEQRTNCTVIRNNHNMPLNHIWNDLNVRASSTVSFLTFLNNDIRITANYLQDTVYVLTHFNNIGIAVHVTNNPKHYTATRPTKYVMEDGIKQGWEFTLRRSDWVDIPEILKFYCGDDFIFHKIYARKKRAGVILSSPIIHKLSKTREAMGEEFTANIKAQALEDIDNFKKLGFNHIWNNISSHSHMNQDLKQILEVSAEINLCKYFNYNKRLKQHLDDCKNINGIFLDIGMRDGATFNAILDVAIEQDKKLIGINLSEFNSEDIHVQSMASDIHVNETQIIKQPYFEILRNETMLDIDSISDSISFAFIGIFNPVKLRAILPRIWNKMTSGGTMFFPYYNYDTCQSVKDTIDEFFNENRLQSLYSRPQTTPGVRDTYLAVKIIKQPLNYRVRSEIKPLVVACVLKTPAIQQPRCGGIYSELYVNRLASMVKRHTSKKYKFVCLTDIADTNEFDSNIVDEIVPLVYDLRGWWSKMELFRPEVFNNVQVLYFDLDTLITNNIDDFTSYGGNFFALRDFNTLVDVSSGIMGWDSNYGHHIFYKFIKGIMSQTIDIFNFKGGDQEAIEYLLNNEPQWVQDLFPNKMAAFKYQCYNTHGVSIPEPTSVVCFHGVPKMIDLVDDPVISYYWN